MQPGRGQGSFWSWDRFIAGSVKFRTNVKSEHQQWSDFLGPFSSNTISIAMFFWTFDHCMRLFPIVVNHWFDDKMCAMRR